MDYEQDYIMRMIKEAVRALASVIFGKRMEQDIDEKKERDTVSGSDASRRIFELAGQGMINEAENLLLDSIDYGRMEDFRVVLEFYEYINDFSDDYLEAHNYSREEIKDGIRQCAEGFGVLELAGPMLEE